MSGQTVYRVVRWRENYEVSEKGRPWRDGDALRRGPLEFIRLKACGRAWPESWRDLLAVAGDDAATCFGVFIKALEIAGGHDADKRGYLLGRGDVPMGAADLAQATGFSEADVSRALEVLCDPRVGWLECIPGGSGRFRELPELPGIPAQSINQSNKQEECVKSEADCAAPPLDESKAEEPADPLADFPLLSRAWPKILDGIQRAHPKAKLPRPGSKAETESREALARLVRLDRYEEAGIVETFKWLFTSDDESALFWRRQVAAIPPLRKRRDGLSKFDRIHEARQKARGGAPAHGGARGALRAAIVAHTGGEGVQ